MRPRETLAHPLGFAAEYLVLNGPANEIRARARNGQIYPEGGCIER
jgi:hypothetical protein